MNHEPRRNPEPHAAEFAVAQQQCEYGRKHSRPWCITHDAALLCPGPASPARELIALPADVRAALEWIRDYGAGDTVGVYDRARFLARRLLTAHGENRQ